MIKRWKLLFLLSKNIDKEKKRNLMNISKWEILKIKEIRDKNNHERYYPRDKKITACVNLIYKKHTYIFFCLNEYE